MSSHVFEKPAKAQGTDLGSSSRLRSRRSRCCRRTPTRTGSTGLSARSSGRTLPSHPGGRNGSSRWTLEENKQPRVKEAPLKAPPPTPFTAFSRKLQPGEATRRLTAVHLIAGVLAVDHLVAAAEVGDAAAVFALELPRFAQGHWRGETQHGCSRRRRRLLIGASRGSRLLLQGSSSEWSPQSSVPSHQNWWPMQRPLMQRR